MEDQTQEAMEMLFRARWNVPRAARHCGMTDDQCKEFFNKYCETRPASFKESK